MAKKVGKELARSPVLLGEVPKSAKKKSNLMELYLRRWRRDEVVTILARQSGIVLNSDSDKSVKSHEEDFCFARTFRSFYGSSF